MKLEELDFDTRMRIERAIGDVPPIDAGSKWRVLRIQPWIVGASAIYVVECMYGDGFVVRGLVVLTEMLNMFLPDAASAQFLASLYTDSSLERYNAGHDPRYRGM